jgi:hypothetical protein
VAALRDAPPAHRSIHEIARASTSQVRSSQTSTAPAGAAGYLTRSLRWAPPYRRRRSSRPIEAARLGAAAGRRDRSDLRCFAFSTRGAAIACDACCCRPRAPFPLVLLQHGLSNRKVAVSGGDRA